MRESILSGAVGAALKRLPLMAAARKAFADDLRRLHRVNPDLARRLWARHARLGIHQPHQAGEKVEDLDLLATLEARETR